MKNLMRLSFILIPLLWLNFASCQTDTTAVSNEKFRSALKDSNVMIIDVRTTEEHQQKRIPNSVHMDVLQSESFKTQVASLPKHKKYLLYCRSGRRSATALSIMKAEGFTNVVHLKNGITGWDGETE